MTDTIHDAYLELLAAVRDNPKPFRKYERLVAHYPMRGLAERVDVMFIGRALNDWTWQFTTEEVVIDPEDVLRRIKRNVAEKAEDISPRQQLSWVDERDADHPDYNSNRSQFWQTIREVMWGRGAEEDKWWHGIVWSNFLKLSHQDGNPSARMVNVIGKPSLELLLAEIEDFQPKHIVCLSGLDYAADLLARCEETTRLAGFEDTAYVEYAGVVRFAGEREMGLLVMPHPQGRKRAVLVQEVLEKLDGLEAMK